MAEAEAELVWGYSGMSVVKSIIRIIKYEIG